MTDIRALVQTALDAALSADNVRSYWRRKVETAGEDPDEYLVYTLDGGSNEAYADDVPLVSSADITIRYYYRDTMLDTSAGRATIKAREQQISDALKTAGFTLPNGYFDTGDIDDIGFGATIFPAEYWRVV